jgi:hypothetical protein
MLIDCYGFPSNSIAYQKQKKHFAESVKIGGFTYIRFGTDDIGPIHRLDESAADNPKLLWAYGSWADKGNISFATDLNAPIDIGAAE